ncbi:MAG: hypothetical protein WBO73_02750 [Gammaproteobacteria bacterium]
MTRHNFKEDRAVVSDMIKLYSKRLLSPFVGMVQVAEFGRARALSLDGHHWAVQYSLGADRRIRNNRAHTGLTLNYSLVATIEHGQLKTHALHPFLDRDDVRSATRLLFEAINSASLPYAAADRYEYWLLDGVHRRPLALLHSCINEEEMALTPPRPLWIAMPAAQLEVKAPKARQGAYVPPVNYRLQKHVQKRAGINPRAAWFERPVAVAEDFPPCLIKENWENEAGQQLCDLYIRRLAPRLLMTQGLSTPVRHRLEQAARAYVFEVDRFYLLYPVVVDKPLLNAARVEARLRRAV